MSEPERPDGPFGRRGPGPAPRAPRRDGAAEEPIAPPRPPPPPRAISSVTWILGVAVVLALAYITLNTIQTDAPGSRGVPVGERLPPFAAPLVTGSVEGDANVALRRTEDVRRRACEVRGEGIVNSCELAERGPVVVGFLATRSEKCEDQVDVLDRLQARFPDVAFVAVAIRGDRDDLREMVRKRGWRIPVAYDRDGAVANAYAVAICPTVTFARAGGKVAHTSLGLAGERELARRIEGIRR